MSGDVTVQELAAALIRVFEGLRLVSYRDAGGTWTIGFGRTRPVKGVAIGPGMTITEQEAEDFLLEDAAPLFALVKDKPLLQAAALVSFGYNCGQGALQRVLAGQAHPEDFVHAGGKVLAGLVSRRKLETLLMTVGT